jgi:hypothetical protein
MRRGLHVGDLLLCSPPADPLSLRSMMDGAPVLLSYRKSPICISRCLPPWHPQGLSLYPCCPARVSFLVHLSFQLFSFFDGSQSVSGHLRLLQVPSPPLPMVVILPMLPSVRPFIPTALSGDSRNLASLTRPSLAAGRLLCQGLSTGTLRRRELCHRERNIALHERHSTTGVGLALNWR